jgi:hypothetical protein
VKDFRMRVFTILPMSAIAAASCMFAKRGQLARSAPLRATSAALSKPFKVRFAGLALLSLAALVLAGWRDAPVPPRDAWNPDDPRAPVPRAGYRSTIGPYKSRRPVEPAPWNEQNRGVAPQPKSGQ